MIEFNKIHNVDCIEGMKQLPDNSVDLIITSPPYNKGYWSKNRNMMNGFNSKKHPHSYTNPTKARCINYDGFDDNIEPKQYIVQQKKVIKECLRVLKPTGSLFYNHIDILSEHQTIHPTYVYDFPIKQIIIWDRKNTPKIDLSYFFPITEYVFWIQKTKESRTKFSKNKCLFNKNVWRINPDVNNSFPAPFPEKLVKNCILSCSDEGDVVLDPYSGSGTTCAVARQLNRKYIGFEISKRYCELAQKRLEKPIEKRNLIDFYEDEKKYYYQEEEK